MECGIMVTKKITSVCPMDLLIVREQLQGKEIKMGLSGHSE